MLLATMVLVACAHRHPPEFKGDWTPLNRFPDATSEIPLQQGYVFVAEPTDRTLRGALSRWATETGRRLEYGLLNDYTLHAAVANIRSDSGRDVAQRLQQAYSSQDIAVSIEATRIVVRAMPAAPAPGADAGAAP